MTINTALYHQANLRLTLALGDKLNAGDATFEPVGFDGIYLLIKQFPHPKISPGAEIEVPNAGGSSHYEMQPMDTKFQGQITMLETVASSAQRFVLDTIDLGGYFDARIYEGTPLRNTGSYLVERCFIKLEPSDRDWENRQQILQLSGTIYGHFFGKTYPGNTV